MKLLYFFTLLIFVLSSCSKDNTLGPKEMWAMATKVESNIELVAIPNHETERRVLCSHYYPEGCIPGSGKRIKVRLVELLVIQYEKEEQACEAAKRIGEWYFANWLFDDVTNEPVLESYVVEAFNAIKPKPEDSCR